jgi:hypothetical protein
VRDWKLAQRKGDKRGPKARPEVLKLAAEVHRAVKRLHGMHGAAKSLGEEHKAALGKELAAIRGLLAALS